VARRPRGGGRARRGGRGAWAGPLTVAWPCCAPDPQAARVAARLQALERRSPRAGLRGDRRLVPVLVGRPRQCRGVRPLGDDGRAAPGLLPGARRLDCRADALLVDGPLDLLAAPRPRPVQASSSFCPRPAGRTPPPSSSPRWASCRCGSPSSTATPAAPRSPLPQCWPRSRGTGSCARSRRTSRPTASTPTRLPLGRAPDGPARLRPVRHPPAELVVRRRSSLALTGGFPQSATGGSGQDPSRVCRWPNRF